MPESQRYTCVLLTSGPEYLADAAVSCARALFAVRHVSHYQRKDRNLTPEANAAIHEGVDFLISFLCPVIFNPEQLASARRAAVNLHPAPPEHPGVGASSFALYHGESTFGVTAHLMHAKVDSGPILRTLRFPIFAEDSCETLFVRSQHYSLYLFFEIAEELARLGEVTPSGETWKRKATSRKQFEKWMLIAPTDSQEEIGRKIRALRHSRFPGPFLEFAGHRFELPPAASGSGSKT